MSVEEQLLVRLAAANPMVDGSEPPPDVLGADELFHLIETRSGDMVKTIEQTKRPMPPERQMRAAWALAGAFIVVIVSVALAAFLLRSDTVPAGDETPTTTAAVTTTLTPTTTVPPTTTSAPTPPPPPVAGAWHQVATAEAFGDNAMVEDIVFTGAGFIASGEINEGAGAGPAIWVSPDGSSWQRATVPESPSDYPYFQSNLWQLATADAGTVLWRFSMFDDEKPSVVYHSTDGLTWSEATLGGLPWSAAAADPPHRVHALAGSPSGFVAVGGRTETETVIYASADGATWTEVDAEIPATIGRMEGIAGWGGGWISWGWDCATGSVCEAIWHSPDGVTWTEIALDWSGDDYVILRSVVEHHDSLVGVGSLVSKATGRGEAALFTSTDGFAWEITVFGAGPEGSGLTIAAGADMVVLTASSDQEALDRPGDIWMMRDGGEWVRIASDETFGNAALHGLAVSEDRVLTGGLADFDGGSAPALWLWITPDS